MNRSDIKVLQINLNRSQYATESTLQYTVENKIDIILVQEPWLYNDDNNDYINSRSINHQGFIQLKPKSPPLLRPRTLAYIVKNHDFDINLSSISPNDPDLLIIDITSGQFDCQLINIYNESDQGNSTPRLKTLERVLYLLFETNILSPNTMILGDFNLYHIWWDPLILYESPGAADLVEWIEDHNLNLLNKPGGTFYRPNLIRESTIDLTFTTNNLVSKIKDWSIIPSLGSDHFRITFTISKQFSQISNPTISTTFNLELADWELFTKTLKVELNNYRVLNSDEFDNFTTDSIDILIN